MAQRIVNIPEVGDVVLSKRKNASYIRLSINGAGKIRVGMPYWTPYAAGIAFVKSKKKWINDQLSSHEVELLKEGDLIGKAHRLHFVLRPTAHAASTRITESSIFITTELSYNHPQVQAKAREACERALRQESAKLLPQRLDSLAKKHNFSYKDVKVRKLISRWGSCSNTKVISLSYYLIQLPWQLIDYVLLHELAHTKHLNHGKGFWLEFEKALPGARKLQKEIRLYKPKVKPSAGFMEI